MSRRRPRPPRSVRRRVAGRRGSRSARRGRHDPQAIRRAAGTRAGRNRRESRRRGAVSSHGHAGRLHDVDRNDQLWSPRLGDRPQRLSLHDDRSVDSDAPGPRCPRRFATSPRARRRRPDSRASSPTPAWSTATSPARGSRCTRIGTSATSARRSSRSPLGLPAVFLFGGARRQDRARRVRLESGDVVVWAARPASPSTVSRR